MRGPVTGTGKISCHCGRVCYALRLTACLVVGARVRSKSTRSY